MIIHLSSEVFPFYKRGGLADVCGALPQYLGKRDKNIVISFYYKDIMNQEPERLGNFSVQIQEINYCYSYFISQENGVDYYFLNLEDDNVFAELETGVSGSDVNNGDKPYKNDISIIEYLYFAKGAVELIKVLKLTPTYLIFHDWHVCGFFAYTHQLPASKFNKKPITILLIHNYEHQGEIYSDSFHLLDKELMDILLPIYTIHNSCSLLSIGIYNADYVATVSHAYAEELTKKALPHAGLNYLDGLNGRNIYSFQNGIDTHFWNTKNIFDFTKGIDIISANKIKSQAKEKFCLETGLNISKEPIILFMARLTEQKGINLLLDSDTSADPKIDGLENLLNEGVKIIICGNPSGGYNGRLHKKLMLSAENYKGRFIYLSGYSEKLAKELLLVSDAILCPSLYEPCGLVHLYAMLYATIPIVRPVGGLKDTVIDCVADSEKGTGFYIYSYSNYQIKLALRSFIEAYLDKESFENLQARCLSLDYSWKTMAEKYDSFLSTISSI